MLASVKEFYPINILNSLLPNDGNTAKQVSKNLNINPHVSYSIT